MGGVPGNRCSSVRIRSSHFSNPLSFNGQMFRSLISTEVRSRFLFMVALVLAGEMIFSLPYHLLRYFRPTVLGVFELSNADLGDVFAPYGVTAMLAYFPGGVLADRFSTRKLMTASLLMTAAGGVYMMTLPGMLGMSILFAVWGITTILTFWCALIRATRSWGGRFAQGRGFGLLDAGRGLAGASFASVGVLVFSVVIGPEPSIATPTERAAALQTVILYYTLATLAAAIAVWWWIPDAVRRERVRASSVWSDVRAVLGTRSVWLQAVIVVCAYSGYKALDNYSLYAYDVLGMNETEAAAFTATFVYSRPFAAILAGLAGDRFGVARMTTVVFGFLAASWALLSTPQANPDLLMMVYVNLLISIFGVYALRGLYFALLEQTRVPLPLTGAAVGLISVVGYSPDIFFSPIAGRLLDATPGLGGHQNCFAMMACIAAVGLMVAAVVSRGTGRQPDAVPSA